MAIQGTVPVGGSFAPTDSADSFGTHNDKWGIGGHRVVKTITARDGIPVNESGLLNLDDELASGRRKLGMFVYVSDEDKFYILKVDSVTWDGYSEEDKVIALADNANWVEFSGGTDTGNIGFENNWIKNTVDEEIFISPQDGYTWLWLPSDTQAAAGDYVNLASTDPDSAGVYITTNAGSWQFKNDGILEVPGRISFGGLDWQSIGVGNVDAHGGAYGISLYCTIGYELNWQAGYLAARDYTAPYDIIPIFSDSLIKYATPVDYPAFYGTFDADTLITKGYLEDQAYLTDAAGSISNDGKTYGRKDGAWSEVITTGGGIPKGTASDTDTYTTTITGVAAYNDGDAYLIRFTNGNTTEATLNINSLGAKTLYRNNDGPIIGGDILAGAEMLCVYNSTTNSFQCIGTSPNTILAYVTNADTVTINKGDAVYVFGAQGDRITVKRAVNTSDATSAQTLGIVYSSSIGVNQKGIIITQGELTGLSIFPTSTWDDGDPIYLGSTAGSLTPTKPYAPNHLVYIGFVITASNGSSGRMFVKVQNGYELDEIHDVDLITSAPVDGDVLGFNGTSSLWVNIASTSLAISANNLTTGTVPLARLGTNTPTSNTFLAWDNTWRSVVASGGTIASGTNRRLAIYTSTTGLDDTFTQNSTFTTNILLGTATLTASNTLTIPVTDANASFVMTVGEQSIIANKSFLGTSKTGPTVTNTQGIFLSAVGGNTSETKAVLRIGATSNVLTSTRNGFISFGTAVDSSTTVAIGSRPTHTKIILDEGDLSTTSDMAIGNFGLLASQADTMWFSTKTATNGRIAFYVGGTSLGYFTARTNSAGSGGDVNGNGLVLFAVGSQNQAQLSITSSAFGSTGAGDTYVWLDFSRHYTASAAPSTTPGSRSKGTRIVLINNASYNSGHDMSIGVEGITAASYYTWFNNISTASSTAGFKFYGAGVLAASINTYGVLALGTTVASGTLPVLQINGTKVVGAQITGWGTPGGTLTRTTIAADVAATPTAAQFNALAQNVRALITDLRSHGLIGT